MPKRYLGNIITDTPTAPAGPYEDSVASGVWSLAEANTYTAAGLWPTAGNAVSIGFLTGGRDSAEYDSFTKVEFPSGSQTVDFGTLSSSVITAGGVSSTTRSVTGGGIGYASTYQNNVIEFFTMSSGGSASDFGDLTIGGFQVRGASNATRGLFLGRQSL